MPSIATIKKAVALATTTKRDRDVAHLIFTIPEFYFAFRS